jgi:lactoylglutathione lyase
MKLHDFRLLVNDFAASLHFWHEIVGLSIIFRDENNIYAELDADNVRIELLDASYFASSLGEATPTPIQSGHRGVIAFQSDDVDATYADLVKRGAPSLAAPHVQQAGFARIALFSAPDGYVLEVFTSLRDFPNQS